MSDSGNGKIDEKKDEKHTFPDTLKTVCIGPGGMAGLVALGVLKKIEEHYDVDSLIQLGSIDTLIGASIGSMVCLFMSFGYSSTQILHIFRDTRHKWVNLSSNLSLDSLIQSFGLCSFDEVINIVADELQPHVLPHDIHTITFEQLYQIQNIHLSMTSTRINTHTTEILNHELTPNLPVLTAVKMSCAMPLLFESVHYNGDVYIDGGVLNQLPYSIINDDEHTLMIIMDKHNNSIRQSVDNLEDFIMNVINMSYVSSCNHHCSVTKLKYEKAHVHTCYHCSSSTDFEVTQDVMDEMFLIGYNGCGV